MARLLKDEHRLLANNKDRIRKAKFLKHILDDPNCQTETYGNMQTFRIQNPEGSDGYLQIELSSRGVMICHEFDGQTVVSARLTNLQRAHDQLASEYGGEWKFSGLFRSRNSQRQNICLAQFIQVVHGLSGCNKKICRVCLETGDIVSTDCEKVKKPAN